MPHHPIAVARFGTLANALLFVCGLCCRSCTGRVLDPRKYANESACKKNDPCFVFFYWRGMTKRPSSGVICITDGHRATRPRSLKATRAPRRHQAPPPPTNLQPPPSTPHPTRRRLHPQRRRMRGMKQAICIRGIEGGG